jgi:NAD-dependent dihydropyrimidine dehydrogenase PreA subunit
MSVFVVTEKCNGCGLCIPICPVQAISIIQNKAFIDRTKCVECLQCMDECPTNAIHQIAEKEVYLTQREPSIPSSVDRTVPLPRQTFSSNEWKHRAGEKGGFFLNEVKKAMDNFFKVDSSFGSSKKGGRIKHRRQRKRNRGRRF